MTPSVVGVSWELYISGAQPGGSTAREVEFVGLRDVEVREDPRYQEPIVEDSSSYVPPPTPPLFVLGTTRFGLPSPPRTIEEVRATGVKLVGMTYCGFTNQTGEPREEDIDAVQKATSALLSAAAEPLAAAPLTDDGLAKAGNQAMRALLDSVVDELERRGIRDLDAESVLYRVLGGSAEQPANPFTDYLERVADFLPSLAWTFGDARTRATLSGCGTLMLFDLPEELRYQELPSPFPGDRCIGNNVSHQSLACSLEAFASKETYGKNEATIRLERPLDVRDSVIWYLVPRVALRNGANGL